MKNLFICIIVSVTISLISCDPSNSNQAENCKCEFTARSVTRVEEDFYNYAKNNPYCAQGYTIYLLESDKYGNGKLRPYMKYYFTKSEWEELKKYTNYFSWFGNATPPKWEYLGNSN